MRTTFTVAQDRKLVQLAVVYERRGTRISWSDVRRRMRTNQHTTTELRMRLHALKRTYGPVLADFPACFFSTESSIEDSGGITCRSPMNSEDAIRAVDSLFASVKKADIRQELGKPHTNAGEILPAGVDSLIDSIGYIDDQDIFLDVGCGLGNVLVQFALQTLVSKCYGIEVREEVLFHGLQLMDETPSLRDYCGKVSMVCAEASTIQLAFERPYSQATIILANYRLFEVHVKSHVEEQLGLHDSARVLILGEEVCPRHHASCRSAFCARWHSWKVISVPVSWTLRADLWIYRRKTN
eukprot:jgi/Phyca11/98621/e_gw1.3.899.1